MNECEECGADGIVFEKLCGGCSKNTGKCAECGQKNAVDYTLLCHDCFNEVHGYGPENI